MYVVLYLAQFSASAYQFPLLKLGLVLVAPLIDSEMYISS